MEDLTVHEAASMSIALAVLSPNQEPQWFGQLMLKVDNEPVLSVSRGEGGFGEMQVHVDGKLVKEGAEQVPPSGLDCGPRSNAQRSMIGVPRTCTAR